MNPTSLGIILNIVGTAMIIITVRTESNLPPLGEKGSCLVVTKYPTVFRAGFIILGLGFLIQLI